MNDTDFRGSQYWLQRLVNDRTADLNAALTAELPALAGRSLLWRSPLREAGYAEYWDTAFLRAVDLAEHAAALREFWPRGGPHWDGLARTADGGIVLVEAKANVPEMVTFCRATSPRSLAQITAALETTWQWLSPTSLSSAPAPASWLNGHYQIANRLAHLYFLREMAGVEAYLVFLYVIDDPTHIATGRAEWDVALAAAWSALGIDVARLNGLVSDLFVAV